MNKSSILVVGPGEQTRGGITSVIMAHTKTETWRKWNCVWITSYIDSFALLKILYFIKGYFHFLIRLSNAQLIHIHFSEVTSAKRKYIFLSTSKLFNKKVILHLHAFSPKTTLLGKHKKLYQRMIKQSDSVIALSSYWAKQIRKVTECESKIKVLYNPCPLINKNQTIKKEEYILYAGTLSQRKGYEDLILAFNELHPLFPKWRLVFAGNGNLKHAKQIVKELGIHDNVIFKGWISGDEKDQLFKKASIFCLPSYAEGFPMAVLDAWAYGLPVVTTPVGGITDFGKHKENLLLFNPGDINGLFKNLRDLIENKKLRKKLSYSSNQLSEEKFNLKKIAIKLDEIYNELCINN
jgi:glycosyltransferase involved in cell wall biosynthesis